VDDITTLLVAWGRGDEAALQQLIPLVHRELHQIARRCLKGERPGHTLQPTASSTRRTYGSSMCAG
jgi:hypothetical protein